MAVAAHLLACRSSWESKNILGSLSLPLKFGYFSFAVFEHIFNEDCSEVCEANMTDVLLGRPGGQGQVAHC